MLKRKLSPKTIAVIKYMLDRPKNDYYGLELIEATGMPAGTIYPVLTRLEEIGWISGKWESWEQKRKGSRRRRYYKLTATGKKDGKKYLANGIKELNRLGLLEPQNATIEKMANSSDNATFEMITSNVQKDLNSIKIENTNTDSKTSQDKTNALKLFYCYSHKDESLRDELETHLKILNRQGLFESWSDRKILAGKEWKGEIDTNLEQADIILLLVSSDFIASDFCYNIEMTKALERHEAKEATVIPIIVRKVLWQGAPFSKLQALPKDGKAVELWDNKDSAWYNVSEGISKVISDRNKN